MPADNSVTPDSVSPSSVPSTSVSPSQARKVRQQWIAFLLVIAIVLRLPGMWTDFWMDEIWSWTLVWDWRFEPRVTGIWGIFSEIHRDNNNYLNTLFVYLCGPTAPLAVYRIPAIVAGVATVWLGGKLTTRWMPVQETAELNGQLATLLIGMGLLATSQVAVVYSSEARGYSIAICAVFASQWCLGTLLRTGRWSAALGYAAWSCCGFLGHLSFLPVFVSQCIWSIVALTWKQHSAGSWKRLVAQLMAGFGIPSTMVGGLWLIDLSRTQVGGGPRLSPWLVSRDALAMPWGASLPEWCNLPCALLMTALLLTGLWALRRLANAEAVSLASLLVVAPVILFVMAPRGLVYPRHFLVSMSLLVPVAGIGIWKWIAAERRVVRLAGVVAIGLWCAGNGTELVRFWTSGRGQYQAALQYLSATASGRMTLVSSDNRYRNSLVMTFYQARTRKYRELRYLPEDRWPEIKPHWILAHSFDRIPRFPPKIEAAEFEYELDSVFPFAGPVGFHWGTYRLAGKSH